jgi:hypothetical protein
MQMSYIKENIILIEPIFIFPIKEGIGILATNLKNGPSF